MKVFNAIIGVLAIFGALFCIFWPAVSFLNVGWIVAFVLFLWGVCAIVTYAMDKSRGHKDNDKAASGVLGLVFGIAACVVSILAIFIPEIKAIFMVIILVLLVLFLILAGVKNIIQAFKDKKDEATSKGWVGKLILGIIQILCGILGIASWLFAATLLGILMGVMLGVFGCTLIASVFSKDDENIYDDL